MSTYKTNVLYSNNKILFSNCLQLLTIPFTTETELKIFKLFSPGTEGEEESNIMVVTNSLLFNNVIVVEDKVTTDKVDVIVPKVKKIKLNIPLKTYLLWW